MFTSYVTAPPQKKRALQGRRFVAVDIENVAGGAVITTEMARQVRAIIQLALNVKEGEQVVIGISHIGLFNAKGVWSGARIRVRSGSNGADIELMEILTTEHIDKRFDEVLLVSGDGIFADTVSFLASRGVKVTVASWAESLSSRLHFAAAKTIYLNDWADRPNYSRII